MKLVVAALKSNIGKGLASFIYNNTYLCVWADVIIYKYACCEGLYGSMFASINKWPVYRAVNHVMQSSQMTSYDGAQTTSFAHPCQTNYLTALWGVEAPLGSRKVHKRALAANFLVLGVLAVSSRCNFAVYNRHSYGAPHASAAPLATPVSQISMHTCL